MDREEPSCGHSQKLRAYYEANPLMVSSPFGGVDGINQALLQSVLEQLGFEIAGKRVLDVGCGRGYTGEVVRDLGGEYIGADFVVSRSEFPLIQADAQALPFPGSAFDLVFCVDAFEHFPNAAAAVREFHRVLRPGGGVFLSVPNYGNVAGLVKWWCERFGQYERNTWAPFRRWQPQELEHFVTGGGIARLFHRGGFTPICRIGHGPEAGLGLFPWIDHPHMPEAIQFRLQRLFRAIGPAIARLTPTTSLHLFWRFEK